jgi:hypothetical protein
LKILFDFDSVSQHEVSMVASEIGSKQVHREDSCSDSWCLKASLNLLP